jgi:hypothetical protein
MTPCYQTNVSRWNHNNLDYPSGFYSTGGFQDNRKRTSVNGSAKYGVSNQLYKVITLLSLLHVVFTTTLPPLAHSLSSPAKDL